jgi:hypothetical protein
VSCAPQSTVARPCWSAVITDSSSTAVLSDRPGAGQTSQLDANSPKAAWTFSTCNGAPHSPARAEATVSPDSVPQGERPQPRAPATRAQSSRKQQSFVRRARTTHRPRGPRHSARRPSPVTAFLGSGGGGGGDWRLLRLWPVLVRLTDRFVNPGSRQLRASSAGGNLRSLAWPGLSHELADCPVGQATQCLS